MCVIKPTSEFSPLVKRQLQCTTVPWLWIIANRSMYLCKISVLFINNFHLYSKAPVPLLQLVAGLPFLFLRVAFYLYKLCLTPLSYSLQYSLSLAIPFWAFQAFFICQLEWNQDHLAQFLPHILSWVCLQQKSYQASLARIMLQAELGSVYSFAWSIPKW